VAWWLSECCERGEYPAVRRPELYQAYKRAVNRDGGKPVRASEFYDRLARLGVMEGRIGANGDRVFYGVKLTDDGWAGYSPSYPQAVD
jgi:hypothetical protein